MSALETLDGAKSKDSVENFHIFTKYYKAISIFLQTRGVPQGSVISPIL